MVKELELKNVVKEKYGQIAFQSLLSNKASCCGVDCCDGVEYTIMSDEYDNLKGYNPDADLGLGCGLPTEFANINEGDTVLDLGSGAGNDVFIARQIVGDSGKVIGIDMTPEMLEKANKNLAKTDFKNIEFIFGEIEKMPIDDSSIDVVISNCVLNLVPNKEQAFSEIHRVLKNGAHFCISDIVLLGELPENIKNAATMYAGCVSGALLKDDYLNIIEKNGFKNIKIVKEKQILIPDDILRKYLSDEELISVKSLKGIILSITVYAEK